MEPGAPPRDHAPLHPPRRRHPRPRARPEAGRADAARADRPLRRAAVARPRRTPAVRRLRRQRGRHAEPARGGARARPRSAVRLHVDQQGLRRRPQRARTDRARDALGLRRPHAARRNRRGHADRRDDALALRRVEGRRRRDGPGVRPLLRPAHRLPPRRLPDRPEPLGAELHGFLSYLARAVREQLPYRDLRLQGQAGARQHPRARRLRRDHGVRRTSAHGRGLQPRRRPREQRARCSRRSHASRSCTAAG